MAELLKVADLREGYLQLVRKVLTDGRPSAPRGQETTELLDVTVEVGNAHDSIPVGIGRGLNLGIGAAETSHLIGGLSDAAQVLSITDNFRPFVQADTLHGAYGPRLYRQLPGVVETLASDPDSRQGVVTIWDPHKDTLPGITDRPCTIALQFKVREGALLLHTTMRSNDLWLGLPYDAWMFTRLQQAVAYALGRSVGPYTHTAGSLHVYERDRRKLNDLHVPKAASTPPGVPYRRIVREPTTSAEAAVRWLLVQKSALAAVLGLPDHGLMPWYSSRLDEHISGNTLCEQCRYVLPRRGARGAVQWFSKGATICHACRRGMTQVEYVRSR